MSLKKTIKLYTDALNHYKVIPHKIINHKMLNIDMIKKEGMYVRFK